MTVDRDTLEPQRIRVVYWNSIASPYMVDNFNAVARRGRVDLEVWFGARTESNRSWTVDESTWQFPFRYLPRVGFGWRRLSLPVQMLTARPPDLLVTSYWTPSFLVGLLVSWVRRWTTALWVEATFDAWVRRRRWKEAMKRAIFARVHGIMTPGPDGRAFAMRYGAPSDRIRLVRNAVDVPYYSTATTAARLMRDTLRTDLGVSGVVFLYVGRLWQGKGTDTLMAAYERVERELPRATTLLVVGDGPEERSIARTSEGRQLRIKLAGFHQKGELPRFYAASDVFVFPTLGDPYGLVVDEAMAAQLPIISSTAAGEIRERVVDGVNGFLVPPADASALADAMVRLAQDSGLRDEMGTRSYEMISPFTPESWAEAFEIAAEDIVAKRRPSVSLRRR
jgi:glycosyltransferase involved in cell wall biosynthesis